MEENDQEKSSDNNTDNNKNTMMIVGAIIIIAIIAFVFISQNNKTQQSTQVAASPAAEEVMEEKMEKDSSIEAIAQPADSSVTVDSASFVAPGYIVIHEQVDGAPGPVIGSSALYEAGSFQDVSVALDRESVSGETLYAMLHDDDGNAEYEFPGPDAPTTNEAGDVVVLPFEIE